MLQQNSSNRQPRRALLAACLLVLHTAASAQAAFVISGDVTPSSPASWNLGTNAYVGNTGAGSITVNGATTANALHGYLGLNSGSTGTATFTGSGSKWQHSGELFVGHSGTGTLNVKSGGLVTNTIGYLGRYYGSTGMATFTGSGSKWQNLLSLLVGHSGTGTLNIASGGTVTNTLGTVGFNSSSTGTATVTGSGSKWQNSGYLYVGDSGTGTLNINSGGLVTNTYGYVGTYGSSTGMATVTGSGSKWQNSQDLTVGIYGTGTLNIASGGTVEVGTAGSPKNVTLGTKNSGNGTLNLDDGGTLRLHDGEITQGAGTAAFNFNGGRLEGVANFNVGSGLTQNGGVLAPGNSPGVTTIAGGYTLNAGALEIELDGTAGAGSTGGHDLLVVDGVVTLGSVATLDLQLSFAPTLGQEFLIVDNDGADVVSGLFAGGTSLTANFASQDYQFSISYTAGTGNDISITAVPEPASLGLLLASLTCLTTTRRKGRPASE